MFSIFKAKQYMSLKKEKSIIEIFEDINFFWQNNSDIICLSLTDGGHYVKEIEVTNVDNLSLIFKVNISMLLKELQLHFYICNNQNSRFDKNKIEILAFDSSSYKWQGIRQNNQINIYKFNNNIVKRLEILLNNFKDLSSFNNKTINSLFDSINESK